MLWKRKKSNKIQFELSEAELASFNDLAATFGRTPNQLLKDIASYNAMLVWPGDSEGVNFSHFLKDDPAQAARQIKRHMPPEYHQELIRLLSE